METTEEDQRLIHSLQIIDTLLQFLTKATGQTVTTLTSLKSIIPKDKRSTVIKDIPLLYDRGVLHIQEGSVRHRSSSSGSGSSVNNGQERNCCDYESNGENHSTMSATSNNGKRESWEKYFNIENDIDTTITNKAKNGDETYIEIMVGFPPIANRFASGGTCSNNSVGIHKGESTNKASKGGLHGSTKAAAKRRLAALKKSCMRKKSQPKKGKGGKGSCSCGEPNDEVSTTSTMSTSKVVLDTSQNDNLKQKEWSQNYPGLQHGNQSQNHISDENDQDKDVKEAHIGLKNLLDRNTLEEKEKSISHNVTLPTSSSSLLSSSSSSLSTSKDTSFILPKQAAFAGSQKARPLRYQYLSDQIASLIPNVLRNAMQLQVTEDEAITQNGNIHRKLYVHQAKAIESALALTHTLVCTGTGSGKSLCFLLPILATVMNSDVNSSAFADRDLNDENEGNDSYNNNGTSALIMFPTKALAQDQLTKLNSLIKLHPLLERHIRPGIIDGDTPHQNRKAIAERCNIILSNPDTLHASILPGWKGIYKVLLSKLQYIVIDELHSYEGAFGAHVSLVLSRLYRVCLAATNLTSNTTNSSLESKLVFIGCSATIGHPDEHFRLICPISSPEKVYVITAKDDGSKCAAKHFFVWNPSLLDSSGNCIGRVTMPPRKNTDDKIVHSSLSTSAFISSKDRRKRRKREWQRLEKLNTGKNAIDSDNLDMMGPQVGIAEGLIKRNHAADETARLLAHLVKMRVRAIAFCKTRSLAEWVYDKCISILKSSTQDLCSMVEIYRGGYSASIRRGIEGRLFRNELYGVVGTCALELGVDIGGIDVTLHCGYPGSISSVLQQAGRAGRGATANGPSYSIMVCFSSPSEQHLWKHPRGLLGRGLSAPPAVPLNAGIVSGHLLCASEEFPICGKHFVSSVLNCNFSPDHIALSDHDLFGSEETYIEAFETLLDAGSITLQKVSDESEIETFVTHPFIQKPWSKVSLRSIEPINYSIVDQSHPRQVGTDVICEEAVLDHIPYSRVFYHAYPGAIIMHRGRRYKIHSMNSPPAFASANTGRSFNSCNLGAFAKPTSVNYSTNALSITLITIIKQLHRVEIPTAFEEEKETENKIQPLFEPELSLGSFAGNGVVTVKRTVHGYKRLSLVNRVELSRSEISLPPMEYDTNGLWIDTEASILAELMPDYDKGVHALSHAIIAVAPLFVPCSASDLDCDHSIYACSRVLLFDVRAGGAGTCSLLWTFFFHPDGVLKAAIDLLSECQLECDAGHYKGGCPGCIQAVPCMNFQQDLSRSAALIIAKRMLARIEKTLLYQETCQKIQDKNNQNSTTTSTTATTPTASISPPMVTTPRRKLRQKRLERAANLVSARNRNIVVGRQSWPTDFASSSSRFGDSVDDSGMTTGNTNLNNLPLSPGGGFIKR